ncbi:Nhl domain-containing protein [Thalictrum thalictroides]|uniref:Nhl domain-containing protein n=1 Tax=Thalictrum thalictroides TaxID=46969 RepID=A0A7J6X182_THATH|nr:Nhl domain-containing protein [Thalictrum thalictroides]
MAIQLSSLLLALYFLCSTQHLKQVSAELILEEGYTVSTVLDGNKLPHPMIPSSVLPIFGDGTHELLVLDSPNSVFYTISIPISNGSEIRKISGNGTPGFADGDLGTAMFDRPRSFSVDLKGNVYVADRSNHAIRKISKSGVTTIAGGRSKKSGNVDGPAQDASFSDDFELSFVPELCVLLISDRGNRLIRQMNLDRNDCRGGSEWKLGASGCILLGIACLILGLVITLAGSVVYRCINSREIIDYHKFSETWKRFQINLERVVMTVYSVIKNEVASLTIYLLRILKMGLSQLSLMFRICSVEKDTLFGEQVPLFDSDIRYNYETSKSEIFADQLKDLMSFDETVDESKELTGTFKEDNDSHENIDVSTCSFGSIDTMIHANVLEFGKQPTQKPSLELSLIGISGLVKRK